MLITITEQANSQGESNAAVSFDRGETFPITVNDPFSETEEARLEWYFERRLISPFTDHVTAMEAAQSVIRYGEELFRQIFADSEAQILCRQGVQEGIKSMRFEIAGSPDFHKLHWEAVKDPKLPHPFSVHCLFVRRNLIPCAVRSTVKPSPHINLLIVTARPFGERDVAYRTISQPLIRSLRQANVPVKTHILRPGSYEALIKHLDEVSAKEGPGYYHVVHFDVHGALLNYDHLKERREADAYVFQERVGRQDLEPFEGFKAFLFFDNLTHDKSDPAEASEMAELLMTHQIPVVVLNACQSGKQIGGERETSLASRLMQAGVQVAVAMGYSVTVSAARLMMTELYRELFTGMDLSRSITAARFELYNKKGRKAYYNQTIDLEDWLLPVAYENRAVRLAVREFKPEESEAYYREKSQLYRPPYEPVYGFFGRDLDILAIEKMLLKHNILLINGMGGAGKTTLIHHVARWWQETDFVEKVFYFGYDERAWKLEQILRNLGEKLLNRGEFAWFDSWDTSVQRSAIADRLRSSPHLLILDNMESITGSAFAIPHTLTDRERQDLREFLIDLRGGKTLVLLGSRSREEWLAPQTFNASVHELSGLDPEASRDFGEMILERNGVLKYRNNKNFPRLLALLAGYPLALEVVLPA